jgi:broad specificity phosphatase PhoE
MPDSKTTRVLLIRHGATTSTADDRFAGSSNVELSDAGRQEAARLSRRLSSARIDACFSSDMQRAIDTASIVVAPHNLAPVTLKELREIDHGHWEGMVHKDVEKKYAQEYAAWSADPLTIAPPGGETGISVLARALPAMRKIVTDHSGRTILIASHKATNRLLIAYYLGMDLRRYRDRLGQDVACLNILNFSSPTEAKVMTLNDTAHYA